jgi:phage baseplate assembly protein V
MVTRNQVLQMATALVAPISRRLRTLMRRSVVTMAKYVGAVRLLQVRVPGGSALSDLEHLEPFGFTSHPKKDAEALVLSFDGNGSHSIVLMVSDRRYRLKIAEGEVALYNANGDNLHFKADGTAALTSATKVQINSPATEISGTLTVTGATKLSNTLAVTGATKLSKTLAVTGATTAAAITSGAITATAVTAGGIAFATHKHSYTDDGNPATTGGPQ